MLYVDLAKIYSKLESYSEKLEKIYILANFIKQIPDDLLSPTMLLLQGTVLYPWEEVVSGMGEKLVMRAISRAYGVSVKEVEKYFINLGDLGLVAEKLSYKKRQKTLFVENLTVKKVFDSLRKIYFFEGEGAIDQKINTLAGLLSSAKPIEAKYIIRTVLEDLRIGVGEGLIIEAISLVYNESKDNLEYTHAILHDFGEIIKILRKEGKIDLSLIKPKVGVPIKVMLAMKVNNIYEAFEVVKKPALVEYKYDGFRVQIHKKDNEVYLWTRRLENVTKQFPEVVDAIKSSIPFKNCILEGEIVGYDSKNNKYLPFQKISQRIKRKYDINKMIYEIPVELHLFDIILKEDESLLFTPMKKRREILENTIKQNNIVKLSVGKIMNSEKEAQSFFEKAVSLGLEGVMFKKLDAPYRPGRRVGYMVKLKPEKETLDLVITSAEWGEGKRAGYLTSYTVSCYDPYTGEFLEIGEVGSGIKENKESPEDITFKELTDLLKKYIIKQEGKKVYIKPKVVVEVRYDEIQKSPKYSSGYALRFPRVVRIRYDKSPEEADTIDRISELFNS